MKRTNISKLKEKLSHCVSGCKNACEYELIEYEEIDNKILITAQLEIDMSNKSATKLLEKAKKRNTSPLLLVLRESELEQARQLKEDMYK